MVHKTAEEARQEYIALMGEPLGSVFSALWQELATVNASWAEYLILFGSKSSRVKLLNEAAPYFFSVVQEILWESILLHVARMTDRPEYGPKSTLTIQRLPNLVSDAALKASVTALVDTVVGNAEFCRDWRNRRIAHRDLQLSLQKTVSPLAPASRELVERVLESLAELLNAITLHFKNGTTAFDFHDGPGGARQLLYVLHDGVLAKKSRRERIESRSATPEDWKTPDL